MNGWSSHAGADRWDDEPGWIYEITWEWEALPGQRYPGDDGRRRAVHTPVYEASAPQERGVGRATVGPPPARPPQWSDPAYADDPETPQRPRAGREEPSWNRPVQVPERLPDARGPRPDQPPARGPQQYDQRTPFRDTQSSLQDALASYYGPRMASPEAPGRTDGRPYRDGGTQQPAVYPDARPAPRGQNPQRDDRPLPQQRDAPGRVPYRDARPGPPDVAYPGSPAPYSTREPAQDHPPYREGRPNPQGGRPEARRDARQQDSAAPGRVYPGSPLPQAEGRQQHPASPGSSAPYQGDRAQGSVPVGYQGPRPGAPEPPRHDQRAAGHPAGPQEPPSQTWRPHVPDAPSQPTAARPAQTSGVPASRHDIRPADEMYREARQGADPHRDATPQSPPPRYDGRRRAPSDTTPPYRPLPQVRPRTDQGGTVGRPPTGAPNPPPAPQVGTPRPVEPQPPVSTPRPVEPQPPVIAQRSAVPAPPPPVIAQRSAVPAPPPIVSQQPMPSVVAEPPTPTRLTPVTGPAAHYRPASPTSPYEPQPRHAPPPRPERDTPVRPELPTDREVSRERFADPRSEPGQRTDDLRLPHRRAVPSEPVSAPPPTQRYGYPAEPVTPPRELPPINAVTAPPHETAVKQSTPQPYETAVKESSPQPYETAVRQSSPPPAPPHETAVRQSPPPYETPVKQPTASPAAPIVIPLEPLYPARPAAEPANPPAAPDATTPTAAAPVSAAPISAAPTSGSTWFDAPTSAPPAGVATTPADLLPDENAGLAESQLSQAELITTDPEPTAGHSSPQGPAAGHDSPPEPAAGHDSPREPAAAADEQAPGLGWLLSLSGLGASTPEPDKQPEDESEATAPVSAPPRTIEASITTPAAGDVVAASATTAEPSTGPGATEPAIDPDTVEPAAVEPAAVEPAAIEPAAIEPASPEVTAGIAAVEPALMDATTADAAAPASPEPDDAAEPGQPEAGAPGGVDWFAPATDPRMQRPDLVETAPAEPANARPPAAEPARNEPASAGLGAAQPASAGLAAAQPAAVEPAAAQPAAVEPAAAQPAAVEPAAAGLARTEPTGTVPGEVEAGAGQADPDRTAPDQAMPDQAAEELEDEEPEEEPERRLVDPEQVLAAYAWRFDPETLRERADDPAQLRAVRDRLTDKLEYAERHAVRARLLSLRAVTSRVLGDHVRSVADGRKALKHALATGELRRISITQARLAHALQWRGDYAAADQMFEEANSAELPDRLRAEMSELAGRSAYEQGRYLEALSHFERALDVRRADDDDMIARIEASLDAVRQRIETKDDWGPYPRSREEILQQPPLLHPTLGYDSQLWGYADRDGELIVPERYADARPFHDGLAWVLRPQARAWELIDAEGTVLIAESAGYLAVGRFAEGLAWVSRDAMGGWFAIDRANRVIVAGGFDDVRPFHGGLAPVRRALWGAVDRHGRIVVQPRFSDFVTALTSGRSLDGFTDEGLAVVDSGDRRGVVDRAGHLIVPPVHAALLIHPVAFVVGDRNGRWGALDRRGEPLIDVVHAGPVDVADEIDRLLADTRPVL